MLTEKECNLHGKIVEHKRTKAHRTLFVLEGDDTPSGNALKKGYDVVTCILYDTYITNHMFYNLLN